MLLQAVELVACSAVDKNSAGIQDLLDLGFAQHLFLAEVGSERFGQRGVFFPGFQGVRRFLGFFISIHASVKNLNPVMSSTLKVKYTRVAVLISLEFFP